MMCQPLLFQTISVLVTAFPITSAMFSATPTQFNSLELLWEPLFLSSFPHHMLCWFMTDPTHQTPFAELNLNHIADSMQTILTKNLTKRPRWSLCYFGPPSSMPRVDPLDYHSDKRKPLLLMGPLTLGAKTPLLPLYLSDIPACLEPSLPDPNSFKPDLSDNNLDGTIQAYLYC